MGYKRQTSVKLGRKLKAIRKHLGLTGDQLIEQLNCPSVRLNKGSIQKFEYGLREPSIIVLLQYARLAKVPMETLADDAIELTLK